MMRSEPQPAKVSYFFGKGYRDLGNTIKEAWYLNVESAKGFFAKAGENGYFSFVGGMWLIAALAVIIYGTVIFSAVSIVHIAVLAFFFLLVYAGFSIVWLVDRIYMHIHKISNACPNSNCQEKFLLPVYECECGARHTMLLPGKYGILHRTCLCGRKLPTTFFNGREKVKAFCPKCGTQLDGEIAMQIAIPVIGGPSVGKTCYINMAVDKMMSAVANDRNWEVKYASETDANDHKRAMQNLSQGIRLEKTSFSNLTAYKLLVKLPSDNVKRRVFIYDIAGEMFSSSSDVQKNKAYEYADGFIFVIDPLSIGRYAMEKDGINIDSYGVSTKDFDDILSIMLVNLEKMFDLKPSDVLKKNLAVVINKSDIPGLNDLIGDNTAEKYLEEHPECKTFAEAKNAVCKDFLEKYEAGNFARTAESKFKRVQYFTCSSLGHNKEGIKYEAQNVDKPLLWLLENIDSSMKSK